MVVSSSVRVSASRYAAGMVRNFQRANASTTAAMVGLPRGGAGHWSRSFAWLDEGWRQTYPVAFLLRFVGGELRPSAAVQQSIGSVSDCGGGSRTCYYDKLSFQLVLKYC